MLTISEDVKNAYRQNNPELIKKFISPLWKQNKIDKLVYEIHFFKPPAISFVNFSNFKSMGRDVSDIRSDIVWITTSFQASYHALMCKTYAGFRATLPIMDYNSTILGGLSVGKKIDWMPSSMKEKTTHDSFLVYSKESTNNLMEKYYKDFIKDKQVVGSYILADQTKKINPDLINKINFSLEYQEIIIDNKKYQLNIYPILDFNQNTMAYICTIDDLDGFFSTYYKKLLNNLILIFITALLISILARKSTILLKKQIDYIANISQHIKQREFDILHKKVTYKNGNKLDTLQQNIIDMGLNIEKKYSTLKLENKHKTELITKQFFTDKLTNLLNRNALFRDLDIYTNSYLAILNIQSFKHINDVFGFEAGNLILQQLSGIMQQINKDIYSTYRIGNDEFVILNINSISKEEFEQHIHSIIQKVELMNFYIHDENTDVNINLYAGISFYNNNKLATSNTAMEIARQTNKDYVVCSSYDDNDYVTKPAQLNNMNTIRKIKHALLHDNILVYFQPILDNNEVIIKYEALVRMQDEEKVLSPYFFLQVSQETKYYHQITKQVILKTFETFKNREELFSINLIAQDMKDEETVAFIYKKLDEIKDVKQVIFEIVESESIYDSKEINDFITYVQSLGAKIAIDDFGTGFSNFSYIMDLHPEYIKIDGSLIKNIDTDIAARKTTKAIITFAKELDIKIVAEYIHSKEVYEVCKELGVDEYQGYYFGEPLPLKQLS